MKGRRLRLAAIIVVALLAGLTVIGFWFRSVSIRTQATAPIIAYN